MKLIVIVVAFVIAALVAFMASGMFKKEPEVAAAIAAQPVQQIVTDVEVYVAAQDVEIGAAITEEDLEVAKWPDTLLPPEPIYASEGSAALVGQIASAPIVKGEPLLKTKFRNPNDPSYIAGQLAEGMRAISISMNLTDSVAGFVAPGDLVDVIYTFDLAKAAVDTGDVESTQGAGEEKISISETLLTAVKILAVDSRVSAGARSVEEGAAAGNLIPASVTVAVRQKDAQRLLLAEKSGRLTLALRSLQDKDNLERPRPIAEQDLTRSMPPAYFPILFDDSKGYDSRLVDLYSGGKVDAEAPAEDGKSNPFRNISVYRGTEKAVVEVKVNE